MLLLLKARFGKLTKNNKKIPFKTVLMDSWYAIQRLMALIDNLGKIYYCPLKSNPLVDDTGRD